MKLTNHMKTILAAVLWDMRNIMQNNMMPIHDRDGRRELLQRRGELDAFGARYDLPRWLCRPTTPSDSAVFSRALRNMEDMGLLVRVNCWGRRRTTHIRLTPTGQAEARRIVAEELLAEEYGLDGEDIDERIDWSKVEFLPIEMPPGTDEIGRDAK